MYTSFASAIKFRIHRFSYSYMHPDRDIATKKKGTIYLYMYLYIRTIRKYGVSNLPFSRWQGFVFADLFPRLRAPVANSKTRQGNLRLTSL